MENILNSLNSKESYENFAKTAGTIKDKSLAIDLLCKTPNAWYALDESLKQDKEVIMYYQPSGIVDYVYSLPGYRRISARQYEEETGVQPMQESDLIITTDSNLAFQKGFKNIVKNGKTYQIPSTCLLDDQNLSIYCEIQSKLMNTNNKIESRNDMKEKDFASEYNVGSTNIIYITKYTYDRSKLATIVAEVTKSFEEKQKQMQ